MKYTKDMIAWLERHQKGVHRAELTERFNRRFDTNVTKELLTALCSRNGLKSGVNSGQLKKGGKPWNYGKPHPHISPTRFKKGDRTPRQKPVGSERVCSKDGYILVKIKEPRTWRRKHLIVWEQYHGKLPKSHCIRFLDNDRTNCDINNLVCIHRGANALINRTNPANTDDSDINHAIILSEQINHTVKTIENQRSKK